VVPLELWPEDARRLDHAEEVVAIEAREAEVAFGPEAPMLGGGVALELGVGVEREDIVEAGYISPTEC
jgi:hypothetical protein